MGTYQDEKIIFVVLLLFLLGCEKENVDAPENIQECLHKKFLESFVIEPNGCVIFAEYPDMKFTFLGFAPYTKTHETNVPHARISAKLDEDPTIWEYHSGMVYEDYPEEGTSFSGRVHIGINNVDYTIFFDNIEFTETDTQFIFHNATIRFGYYDDEFD